MTVYDDIQNMGLTANDFREKKDSLDHQVRVLLNYWETKKYVFLRYFEKCMTNNNIDPSRWTEYGSLYKIMIENDKRYIANVLKEKRRIDNVLKYFEGGIDGTIERAKQYPIENLLDTPIKLVSGKKWASCPFHEDRKPSLMIDSQNTCHCFSCGFNGDSIDFAKKLFNLPFKKAVERLQ